MQCLEVELKAAKSGITVLTAIVLLPSLKIFPLAPILYFLVRSYQQHHEDHLLYCVSFLGDLPVLLDIYFSLDIWPDRNPRCFSKWSAID